MREYSRRNLKNKLLKIAGLVALGAAAGYTAAAIADCSNNHSLELRMDVLGNKIPIYRTHKEPIEKFAQNPHDHQNIYTQK